MLLLLRGYINGLTYQELDFLYPVGKN